MTLLTKAPSTAPARAATLDAAMQVLEPIPLQFEGEHANGEFYIPHPSRIDGDLANPSPSALLVRRLLKSTSSMKAFLSGHIGGGKSSELRSLVADKRVQAAFFPIWLDIEPAYRDKLDLPQLLFLMACALFSYGREHQLHGRKELWERPLGELAKTFFMQGSAGAAEGAFEVKLNLVFVELRRELKMEERRREQFRELGKNDLKVLQDLILGLCADIVATGAQKGAGREPLLIIDGLDKVRAADPQHLVFRDQPAGLLDLPLRIVYTIPTGVAFDHCPDAISKLLIHLYPAPILKKAKTSYNPEEVVNEVGIDFFEKVLRPRVEPGLFSPEAVRLAAIYSGGVLRNFFHLLRSAIELAEVNALDSVDARVMKAAIKTVRLHESMSLHEPQYTVLARVHQTNQLPGGDGKYLDQGWVIECFNDKVWYEANPLLWKLIDPSVS